VPPSPQQVEQSGLKREYWCLEKKPLGALGWLMRSGLLLPLMLAASSSAASDTPLTIDQLLAQGWEIAGYASGYDNRTSLILFRHPGVSVVPQVEALPKQQRQRADIIAFPTNRTVRRIEHDRGVVVK
jgi:hypothetical protein